MTETYDHAITGLLQRRKELHTEAATLKERAASIANDLDAIDRVLTSLGYVGTLADGAKAKPGRIVLFYRGELRRFLLAELRASERPLTARELAIRVCGEQGQAIEDRRLVSDVSRRAGKALREMRAAGSVIAGGERSEPGVAAERPLARASRMVEGERTAAGAGVAGGGEPLVH